MENNPNHPSRLHVIVGAGATGSATARLLAARGDRVRIITRSGSGPDIANVERIATDATDQARLIELTTGAAALYNCANPQYHRWATDWPPLAGSLLATAEATGAVLVTLSNLYGYTPDGPMTPQQPLDAPSKKGAIRAAMWHDALAAHEAGRARVVEARASDFIGAGIGDTAHMGDRAMRRIVAGKGVQVFGSPDQPHSWTAVADVARTLVALAHDPTTWGRAWHVPSGAPLTQRELVHRICARGGLAPASVSTMPRLLVKALGLVIAPLREMAEVEYQFTEPFVIDASETVERLGIDATPLDETIDAMLAAARGEADPVLEPVAA